MPESGELAVFSHLGRLLSLLPPDLELTAPLNGGLHLGLPSLLLLEKPVRSVFSLGHLPVQHFLLVVFQGAQVFDLPVDHGLTSLLLISETFLFSLFLHCFECLTFLCEGFDLLFFLNFLKSLGLFDLHELRVRVSEICAYLSNLLLTGNFTLLLTLQVLLSLPLDQFALKHLLFKLLDEVQFESLKLLANVPGVGLLEFVLLLELGAHLLVVLGHLLLLDFDPVSLDVGRDLLLALVHLLLSLLLVRHVAHQHLSLEGLHHVLLLVHRFVCPLNLLPPQLVLVILLLGVQSSPFNLISNTMGKQLEPTLITVIKSAI